MVKYVMCTKCHLIGTLSQEQDVYETPCPGCGHTLVRIHPDDFNELLYRADVPAMRRCFNDDFLRWRQVQVRAKYRGIIPGVRILSETF
jgi:hypothetical protein